MNLYRKIRLKLDRMGFFRMSDKEFIDMNYEMLFGKKVDWNNPKTFNEKLQWLKINDRNPEHIKMVDKYEAKEIARKIIGDEYIIPTIGIYNSFDKIDFDKLPQQFVMKCTHDSGAVVVCKDKKKLDIKAAKKVIEKSLKRNFFYESREWPYKDVKPRIIIEKYYEDSDGELKDYKFYGFNGKVDYCLCCVDRMSGDVKFYYYNRDWKMMRDFSNDGINRPQNVPKPKNLSKMYEIAEKLSEGNDFVRIDLYNVDGKIFFGEFTFYPSGGFDNTRTKAVRDYLDKELKIGGKK